MPPTSPASPAGPSLAQQLLDAQVAFHLAQLSGDQLTATVTGVVDDVLAAAGEHPLSDLVDADDIAEIVRRSMTSVPGSAAVSGIVELVTAVLHEGPATPYPIGDLVDRAQVEAVLDEVLALTPALERSLERLTASPLVGVVASQFMARVVGEVVQANQAVADRVPGLGSLMSLGTSAASRMLGAADNQLAGLIGDTVGKGGTFAVRRLNKIVVETLKDPATREALLQVWDLVAQEQVDGLDDATTGAQAAGLTDAVHELTVTTLAGEHVGVFAESVVAAFFDRFGAYTPIELLDELDIARDDLVADAARIAPGVVDVLRESGDLERLLRERLEPFYSSPEVAALLE